MHIYEPDDFKTGPSCPVLRCPHQSPLSPGGLQSQHASQNRLSASDVQPGGSCFIAKAVPGKYSHFTLYGVGPAANIWLTLIIH